MLSVQRLSGYFSKEENATKLVTEKVSKHLAQAEPVSQWEKSLSTELTLMRLFSQTLMCEYLW